MRPRSHTRPAARPAPARDVKAAALAALDRSRSFNALPPERRRQVAADTEKVFGFLADAGAAEMLGLPPAARPRAARALAGDERPTDADYLGDAGQAFADVVAAVDFPGFVAELVQGVFQAVVDASIQQMEAYAELVANVSKSVDAYMKDNVSEDQARDWLVNQYPDHLEPDLENGKVGLKRDADEDSAPNFMQDLGVPFDIGDVDDEEMEKELVTSARRRIAMDRQQLLATMVMMGLNRIVVTDGQIKAGVVFDLDVSTLRKQHYDRQTSFEYQREREGKSKKKGFWFIKPEVERKFKSKLNVTTDTNFTSDNEKSQDMKVKMTGNVDLRFKSDYFPMEKMVEIFNLDQETVTTTSRQGRPGQAGAGQTPGHVPGTIPGQIPGQVAGPGR